MPPADTQANAITHQLLTYLYNTSGKNIISGTMDQDWSRYPSLGGGKSPGLLGMQFYTTTLPSLVSPLDIIGHWNTTSRVLFHLMFHTCPPMQQFAKWNCTWQDINQARPASLINNILSTGSFENTMWLSYIDTIIAPTLQKLQSSGIPVLWRPFHEMNGCWFWWGCQPRIGELWQQMFHRLTDDHKLHNLLWIWAPDAASDNPFGNYWPGDSYVDIVGCDIYAEQTPFSLQHYQQTLDVAKGRPIALAEVGDVPAASLLSSQQPDWLWFMIWNGFAEQHAADVKALMNDPRTLNMGQIHF